jgi:hypothetical protein
MSALQRFIRREYGFMGRLEAEDLFQALNLTLMRFLYKGLSDDERAAFLARIGAVEAKFDWRDAQIPDGYRFKRLFERCDSKTFYNFKGDSVRIECGWFEDAVSSGRSAA